MSNTKYRPYLSISQVSYLKGLIEKDDTALKQTVGLDLMQQFTLLEIKAGIGAIKGSYVPKPRETIESKLGLAPEDENRYLSGDMTPEEEASYEAKLLGGG